MKVIGLTGGIGSGKSTVARILAELGAAVIDADKIGHEALKPDTDLWREIVLAFGEKILTPSGEIDRKRLSEIVFTDCNRLAQLNRIMHPHMYRLAEAKLEEHHRQGTKVVVLEAPLLVEANWLPLVDEVWVVVTPEPVIIDRLAQHDKFSKEQVLSRIRCQLSPEEKVGYADVIINNDGGLEELRKQVEKAWQKVIAGQ